MKKFISRNIDETIQIGEKIAKTLKPGSVVALDGNLGAGKTMLTKGIAKGLKIKGYKYVNSPSFVIIKEYKGKIPLYHFDVYRLKDSESLENVNYDEYFYGEGVSVVEWADKIKNLLPKKRVKVTIKHKNETTREIKCIF